jgi:hypothetical protein
MYTGTLIRNPINIRAIVRNLALVLSNVRLQHHLSNRNVTAIATTATPATRDVQIVEVGPRDGLQNESSLVSTNNKVKLIELLMNAGCTKIEIGSFVSPKAVPNMANTDDVIQQLTKILRGSTSKDYDNNKDVRFSVLVPTLKYLDSALSSIHRNSISNNNTSNDGIIDEIAIFASASESFSQKVRVIKYELFLFRIPLFLRIIYNFNLYNYHLGLNRI